MRTLQGDPGGGFLLVRGLAFDLLAAGDPLGGGSGDELRIFTLPAGQFDPLMRAVMWSPIWKRAKPYRPEDGR